MRSAIALLATRDFAVAESAFAEAQRLWPDNVTIAVRRIEASCAAGTAEAALARLEVATDLDPLDVARLTARGVLLDRLGRSDEAADVLETAVLLAPEAPVPAAALANSLLHAGLFLQSVPALQRAAQLAPESLPLRNDYAAALNRVHRYREGQEVLEHLLAEHGEQPALLCNLCNSLVSLGQQREGVEVARRATELAPEMHLGWRTLLSALSYCDEVGGDELLAAGLRAGATLPRCTEPPPLAPGRRRAPAADRAAIAQPAHPSGRLADARGVRGTRSGVVRAGLLRAGAVRGRGVPPLPRNRRRSGTGRSAGQPPPAPRRSARLGSTC